MSERFERRRGPIGLAASLWRRDRKRSLELIVLGILLAIIWYGIKCAIPTIH